TIFARLKPGISSQQAAAGMAPLWHSILQDELKTMNSHDAQFRSAFLARHLSLLPGARGVSGIRGQVREPLLVLMAMVGIVLLIACANVANLLIARSAARQKEIAVRLAMGASRWRIVRQLLVESIILALGGGVLGLLFAAWTGAALLRFIPTSFGLLNAISTNPDLRVVAFTFAVALLTGLIFGLAPALQSTRPDLAPVLKEQAGSVQGGAAQARLRKTLVVAQVALSLLLLIASGLFARSLYNLKTLNPGFRADHLMTFSINPALDGYDNRRMLSADERLTDSIAALPGVRAVSYAELGALTDSDSGANITIGGYPAAEHEDMNIEFNWVGPAYFSTMGIPLISGRGIARSDGPDAPKVAVINETFARHFFGRDNPLGRLFCFGAGNVKPDIEIVGVVKDAKYSRLREKPMRFIYLPYVQKPSKYAQATFGQTTFYIRTTQDPIQTASTLRARVHDLDSSLPVLDMKTMEQQIDESIFLDRFIAALSAAFGALATLLAAIGLYGVMAYIVARRTREIGIRMALGADRRNVLSLVMKEVAMMAAIGIAIAVPVSFLVARTIRSQLYGVPGNDPLILICSAAGVALIALLAGYVPALRATRVDPLVALRYE
ncbi:MAG: ABC transporter permease, partial [Bryobacteraceae bacterium]